MNTAATLLPTPMLARMPYSQRHLPLPAQVVAAELAKQLGDYPVFASKLITFHPACLGLCMRRNYLDIWGSTDIPELRSDGLDCPNTTACLSEVAGAERLSASADSAEGSTDSFVTKCPLCFHAKDNVDAMVDSARRYNAGVRRLKSAEKARKLVEWTKTCDESRKFWFEHALRKRRMRRDMRNLKRDIRNNPYLTDDDCLHLGLLISAWEIELDSSNEGKEEEKAFTRT